MFLLCRSHVALAAFFLLTYLSFAQAQPGDLANHPEMPAQPSWRPNYTEPTDLKKQGHAGRTSGEAVDPYKLLWALQGGSDIIWRAKADQDQLHPSRCKIPKRDNASVLWIGTAQGGQGVMLTWSDGRHDILECSD
ncbi:MAG: hypothetical protein ACR2PG_02975 [Hyphomicrobiaceae bacterium]